MEDTEDEVICSDTIKKRKIKSQNIVLKLFYRENNLYRRGAEVEMTKSFYQVFYPNLNVVNIEKPPGFLRKFTPDGKYLISFSYDQTAVEIYEFRGTPAASELIFPCWDDIVPNLSNGIPYRIRSQIFNKLFRLKHSIPVSSPHKQLNRECSLFTNDGRYIIVGASLEIQEYNRPQFYDIYTTNEYVTPSERMHLEDYSIYLVDMLKGTVSDCINFHADRVVLSHNQGIYLYNNTFSILSVLHQTIRIFNIYNGKFVPLQIIGRFCSESERVMYNSVYPMNIYYPYREETITTLKHKILNFLYKRSKDKGTVDGDCYELRKFYQFFDQYKNLRMWKMQLLDEDNLLIKYASEDVVSLKVPEPNSHPAFFVFYNISDRKVLQIFDNTSKELLYLFENFVDMFRNPQLHNEYQYPCSQSNNIHARLLHQKCKQTIISARGGGVIEATKRMLAQLPISAQSFSCSPYLDLNLYSYDDKWISVLERPKACGEYPIRFFDRETGIFKFRIYPGLPEKNAISARCLVAFIFHPTEPFVISVQRYNTDYTVNFHIRNQFTRKH